MTKGFRKGEVVTCVDADCADGLRKGKLYTVTVAEKNDWVSVRVSERIPSEMYLASRFVRTVKAAPISAHMTALKKRSGDVVLHSKLVSFLYELMRDEVTPGKVERILMNCRDPDVTYSNGWLARYAKDVATRLR